MTMNFDARIYVPGGESFIGAAVVAALKRRGFSEVFGERPDEGPDLTDAGAVAAYFREARPEYVFMAAGRIGGIGANQQYPADLMLDNLRVNTNVLHAAFGHGVRKLLYFGSSCSYPKDCPQPMAPESLMTGPLEWTSEFYAIAKISGMKLCQALRRQHNAPFVTAIPANPFGPDDHFDDANSHVIGALIRRMYEARLAGLPRITVWGSGRPRRDFIYADDLGDACVHVMERYEDDPPINIGSGTDTSIREVAEIVREVVGYPGQLEFDTSRPDGMPIKLLDVSRLTALGWRAATPLADAVQRTFEGFLRQHVAAAPSGM